MTRAPYLDPDLAPERRVLDLVSRMTLEEKVGLLFHPYSSLPEGDVSREQALSAAQRHVADRFINHFVMVNGSTAVDIAGWVNEVQAIAADTRLGIPATFSSDPRSGFKSSAFTGISLDSLSRWPEHTGLAAIGDPDLVRDYGDTVRRELLSMGIRVYLGPMADTFTEPRWSRGYGTFGEDVDVVARLTASFVEGLRGGAELGPHSVSAVVKHFPGAGPQLDGNDAIDVRFPAQVYPGGRRDLHLKPFEAAFDAGASQVMLSYGMPLGTDWDETGMAFNPDVVQGLLRERYRFQGIVTTDWNVVGAEPFAGELFGPIAHGMQDATVSERLAAAFAAGVDQFGGDTATEEVCELVRSGIVEEERLDRSVRRILLEKFRLGLFEHRYADLRDAEAVSTDEIMRSRGRRAQSSAMTLLRRDKTAPFPLPRGSAVYAEGVDLSASSHDLVEVRRPDLADAIIVRLEAPWESDPDSALGDGLHGGSLAFDREIVSHLAALAAHAPVFVSLYLERPAVLTDILPFVSILVGDFGVDDGALLDAVTGVVPMEGRLPFDLPRSLRAVEDSRTDVPFDTVSPLFEHGFGLGNVSNR